MKKVTKVVSVPRKELNSYSAGLAALEVMGIDKSLLSTESVTTIGRCSMKKIRLAVGLCDGKWCVEEKGMKGFKVKFIVCGKKVVEYVPERKRTKTLSVNMVAKMGAEQIFHQGQFRPTKKCKSKVKLNGKINYEKHRIAI